MKNMHKINLDEPITQSGDASQDKASTPLADSRHQAELDAATEADDNNHSTEPMKKSTQKLTMIIAIVAVIAGVGTGYGGYKLSSQSASSIKLGKQDELERVATSDQIQVGDVFGVQDEETFSDPAQGYLEAGGINGEGTHKLLRPGGESQTVYLTSSITDLDQFVGMEVKIMGETFKGQKAGWLMDVGRVEVLETEAQPPAED